MDRQQITNNILNRGENHHNFSEMLLFLDFFDFLASESVPSCANTPESITTKKSDLKLTFVLLETCRKRLFLAILRKLCLGGGFFRHFTKDLLGTCAPPFEKSSMFDF